MVQHATSSRSHALAIAIALGSCAGPSGPAQPVGQTHEARVTEGGSDEARADAVGVDEELDETGPPGDIPFWTDGRARRPVTRERAERRGLALVDLGEAWAPTIFTEDPSLGARGRQPYRREFLRLANEQHRRQRDPMERHLELYGIFPTLNVVRARLADEERHRCHDAVDDAAIASLDDTIRPGSDPTGQRRRVMSVQVLRRRLEDVARRRRLPSIDALDDGSNSREAQEVRRLRRMEPVVAAIRAVQAHLRCEGTLSSRARDGELDAHTGRAIRIWQSRHMIISLAGRLDETTRASLTMDSRELDFLTLLRALRERVVDATGILEDGSASNQWGTVVGRQLQIDDEFRAVGRVPPLPNGAPDLVSAQTDAAARALGWTDPAAALAWLDAHARERADHRVVALPLPPPPEYHSRQMDLRVEIDRGDVHYAFPFTPDGRPRGMVQRNRPVTTIFARHQGREIALVRWNTTIGGWQPEVNPQGGVGMRYKESDVGPRIWRHLIAGPAWLPPPSTPDDELLVRSGSTWRVNDSITGPGYDSAYGLAMVIHHIQRGEGPGAELLDNGIRSHGSVSYRSILRGYSHGCHRLFNHLAVRMGGFLLHHRAYTTQGQIAASLRRELRPAGSEETHVLELTQRGFLFDLDPPVPVEVLPGNIRGNATRPPTGFFPLPAELQAQARAEAEPAVN